MRVGEMVQAIKDRTPEPRPEPVTPPLTNDLLNAPGKTCECGDEGCCNPIRERLGRP